MQCLVLTTKINNKIIATLFAILAKIEDMKCAYSLLFLLIVTSGFSQQKKIWGLVLDSATKQPIEYASITNIGTNKTSISNTKGRFSIDIVEGNILSVASINHYFDTLMLSKKNLAADTLIVYLKAISQNLKEVTVTAILNRYQNDSAQRRKNFLEDVGSNKIPTVSSANSGAGIGINLDRFSKREKNKRRAFDLFESMEKEQYINYRFSIQLVSRYTTLRDEQLFDFMQQHRPSYKWLRNHITEEDMKYYINEQLKVYFKKSKKVE